MAARGKDKDCAAARDPRLWVARAVKNMLSRRLCELRLVPPGDVTLIGDALVLSAVRSWAVLARRRGRKVNLIGRVEPTTFWTVPQSGAVVLGDALCLTPRAATALRKLFSRLAPGGFVAALDLCPPPHALMEEENPGARFDWEKNLVYAPGAAEGLGAADFFHARLKESFEQAGFEVLKASRFRGRFFGRALPAHRDAPRAGANRFCLTPGGRIDVENSGFIAPGWVYEKAEAHLILARRPAQSACLCGEENLPGARGMKFRPAAPGDRAARYFLAPGAAKIVPPEALRRVERCLGTSFSGLEAGKDYDFVSGRSLYIQFENGGGGIKAVKIKGATFDADKPFKPFEAVPESLLHFDRAGVYFEPNFDDKPMGCMTWSQALNEYTLMGRAAKKGVHCDRALGLVHFPGLGFQNRPVGAALIGVEDPREETRFFTAFNRLLGSVSGAPGRVVIRLDPARLPKLFAALTHYGRALREFHGAGLLHVLGHNAQLSLREGGRVVFHDFEYSLSQTGMSAPQRAAFRLQDIRRALFGLKIYKSGRNLGFDFGSVFLSGYFYDAPELVSGTSEESLNDTVLKFQNPDLMRRDPLIQWMLQNP